jgi:hypothetical protein
MDEMDIFSRLIPGIFGFIGVVVGGFITYFIEKSKFKDNESQRREQVYSQLNGRKSLTSQLYKSYFEAFIQSEYYNYLGMLPGPGQTNPEKKSYLSEDLALEKAKSNQSLFETIGLIQILFPSTNELDELIKPLLDIDKKFKFTQYRTQGIREEEEFQDVRYGTDPDELHSWRVDTIEKLEETVKLEIENPIDKLLDHLKRDIHKERTKHRWEFW